MKNKDRSKKMMVFTSLIVSIFILSSSVFSGVDFNSEPGFEPDYSRDEPLYIKMKTGTFDPLSKNYTGRDDYREADQDLHLIQFSKPIKDKWLNKLEKKGVKILEYVPDNTYIVHYDDGDERGIGALDIPIRWMGEYTKELKVDPSVYQGEYYNSQMTKQADDLLNLTILVFNDENSARSLETIRKSSEEIYYSWPFDFYTTVRGRFSSDNIDDISSLSNTYWIEPYRVPSLHDEVSAEIVGGNFTQYTPWNGPGSYVNSLGYTGSDVIVSVVDTGLDDGRNSTMHLDLKGRVAGFIDYTEDYDGDGVAEDTYIGHGTHCAGIIAGDGSYGLRDSNDYLYGMGVAPESWILAQRVFGDNGYMKYPSFSEIMADANRRGAYISSNSWGASSGGAYTVESAQYDALVRDSNHNKIGNQEMIIEFSAGNDGPLSQTIASPGTAKNVITTGASENFRPIMGDSSDNIDQIAYFSSRGPCEDGRIKPDIVAPGSYIASAKSSSMYSSGYPINQYYQWMSGTSMSGPHVSGASAVFVQFYKEEYGTRPSPALTKAALIMGADDMDDRYNTEKVPNMDEGWGRLNLSSTIVPQTTVEYDDQGTLLKTGESSSKTIYVGDDSEPLKVMLSWTDAPAYPGAVNALVNDLDLTVTDPGGRVYRGNQFSNGWSDSSLEENDNINNVEAVYINSSDLKVGKYWINVTAQNVPKDGVPDTSDMDQDYALVTSYKPPSEKGVVNFDKSRYKVDSVPKVILSDTDLNQDDSTIEEYTVELESENLGDKEDLLLSESDESSGIFTADIPLKKSQDEDNYSGVLDIKETDKIYVYYHDLDDGSGKEVNVSDFAIIDDTPPVITNVTKEILPHARVKISWETDELADSRVRYGRDMDIIEESYESKLVLDHEIELTNLEPESQYYFSISSTDFSGNTVVKDNGSSLYRFTTPFIPDILLVDDDNSQNNGGPFEEMVADDENRANYYRDALTSGGYTFDTYVVPSMENGPRSYLMKPYKLVIWLTGFDGVYPSISRTITGSDNVEITEYIEYGGNMWLIGPNIVRELYGKGKQYIPTDDFLRRSFGVKSAYWYKDDGYNLLKGEYGTLSEGVEYLMESHWDDAVKESPFTELNVNEKSEGLFHIDEDEYGYNSVKMEENDHRTAFFGWELSFLEREDMIDIMDRMIDWFMGHPVSVTASPTSDVRYGFKGETVEIPIQVFNSGINGPDVYDISCYSSGEDWNYRLVNENGTELIDSDSDSILDTGKISPGGRKKMMLEVDVNETTEPFDYSKIVLAFTSSVNPKVNDTCELTVMIPIEPPWIDHFDDLTSYWSAHDDGDGTAWERGEPSTGPGDAYSGYRCWGTNLDSDYTAYSDAYLVSPPISLRNSSSAIISFKNWHRIEKYNDGGFLEIQDKENGIWKRIYPEGGYPYRDGYFGGYHGSGYTGGTGGWITEKFDLHDYIGKIVRVRFHFSSSLGKLRDGWYIDDFKVHTSQYDFTTEYQKMSDYKKPNQSCEYNISVENLGSSDTIDITTENKLGWKTHMYDEQGNELTDTDGDGLLDTGLLANMESTNISIKVHIPDNYTGHVPETTAVDFISIGDGKITDSIELFSYRYEPILLVDDDAGINSERFYTDSINSTSYSYNIWCVEEQGSPDYSALADHEVVIWFTGNDKGHEYSYGVRPLYQEDIEVISKYLDSGGNFYLSSQGAGHLSIQGDYEDFMRDYFGFRARGWWALPNTAFGVDGTYLGDKFDLELAKGDFCTELDPWGGFGEPVDVGKTIFKLREGWVAGTRVDNGRFITVHTAFDFASIKGEDNRDAFMGKLLNLLSPQRTGVIVYPDDGKDGTLNDTVSFDIKVRNIGTHTDDYRFETLNSSANWTVEIIDKETDSCTNDTGNMPGYSLKEYLVDVNIPDAYPIGSKKELTVKVISNTNNSIGDWLNLTVTIPRYDLNIKWDEENRLGTPNETVTVPFVIENLAGVKDVVNLHYNSDHDWSGVFYETETGKILNDTDGDGTVDSGEIDGLNSKAVYLEISIPENISNGSSEFIDIVFTSDGDPLIQKSISFLVFTPVNQDWSTDMEGNATGWTVTSNNRGTDWGHGNISNYSYGPIDPYSGESCWGTNLRSNYTKNCDVTLTTPLIDLNGVSSSNMSYYHWFDIWGDDPGNSQDDGGFLEVSTDLGDTWEYVVPDEGYNETLHTASPVGFKGCYGQASNGWRRGTLNLTPYINDYILVRFHFWASYNSNEYAGWYIDDVSIHSELFNDSFDCNTPIKDQIVRVGDEAVYDVDIRNLGKDNDSFDISLNSQKGWNYTLTDEAGKVLEDTNSDPEGLPDSGTIESLGERGIKIVVETLSDAKKGDFDVCEVKISSNDDPSLYVNFSLRTMIPYNAPYFNDMEGNESHPTYDLDRWNHYKISGKGYKDNWMITDNRSHRGNFSYWSGEEVSINLEGGDTALETPYLDLTTIDDPILSFWHWYDFSGHYNEILDGGVVEIYDNVTMEWQQITPLGGYDDIISSSHRNPLGDEHGYTYNGDLPDWQKEFFDLSSFNNKTIKIRFHVGLDYGSKRRTEGWYIDDVYIGPERSAFELNRSEIVDYTHKDVTKTYDFKIINSGGKDDKYMINLTTSDSSDVSIYYPDWTEVVDTNGDSLLDTATVNAGDEMELKINISLDETIESGHFEKICLLVHSEFNASIRDPLDIRLGVPYLQDVQTQQTYREDFEDPGNINEQWTFKQLNGVYPGGRWNLSSIYSYDGYSLWSGSDPSRWPKGGESVYMSPFVELTNPDGKEPATFLSFWHKYNFGTNDLGPGDGGFVEIWDNDSREWNKIYPTDEHMDKLAGGYRNPLEGTRCYVLDNDGWRYERYNISDYMHRTIRFRFHQCWDRINDNKRGWIIDDISIGRYNKIDVSCLTVSDKNPTINQGEELVEIMDINISAERRNTIEPMLEELQFHFTGTISDEDIESVSLFLDVNEDGMVNQGEDDLLSMASSIGKTVNFHNINLNLTNKDYNKLIIAVNISDAAPHGCLLGSSIPSTDFLSFNEPYDIRYFKTDTGKAFITGDNDHPQVLSTTPESSDPSVSIHQNITITFSEEMDRKSVENGLLITSEKNIWGVDDGNVTWRGNGDVFTFDPNDKFSFDTDYSISLNCTYVKDIHGNFLDGNGNTYFDGFPEDSYSWAFKSQTYLEWDQFSPSVISTSPMRDEKGVAVDQDVKIVFNESMDVNSEPLLEGEYTHDPGSNISFDFTGWETTSVANDTALWSHVDWRHNEEITLSLSYYSDLAGNVGRVYVWNISTKVTLNNSAWPTYKQNRKRTGLSPYDVSENHGQLKWRFETGIDIVSSPAMDSDGNLYFGTIDGHIYSLDKNGTLNWVLQTDGRFFSSPTIGLEGTLFVGSQDGTLYAISNDGEIEWTYETVKDGYYKGIWSTPLIGADGCIYFGTSSNYTYALFPNGTKRWSYEMDDPIYSSLVMGMDGNIIISTEKSDVYSFSSNGSIMWKYDATNPTSEVVDSPCMDELGNTYISENINGAGYLQSIDKNGSLNWRSLFDGFMMTSPSIGPDGDLYLGSVLYDDSESDDFGLTIHSIDTNGYFRWNKTLDAEIYQGVSSITVSKDGMILLSAGELYCLDSKEKGKIKWTFDHPLNDDTIFGSDSDPIIDDRGTIYLSGQDKALYAVDEDITKPISVIDPDDELGAYQNDSSFDISYEAEDMYGIHNVSLYYKRESTGWTYWNSHDFYGQKTVNGTFDFNAASEGRYYFYTICSDSNGNKELKPDAPYINTTVDLSRPNSYLHKPRDDIYYTNKEKMIISYDAEDSFELAYLEVYKRRDGGNWTLIKTLNISGKSARGDLEIMMDKEGVYEFYSKAYDKAGNEENVEKESDFGDLGYMVDMTAPKITYLHPGPYEKNISLDSDIKIQFSEPVNYLTLRSRIYDERNTTIISTVNFSNGNSMVTFSPLMKLNSDTQYVVSIEAEDLAGNEIKREWTFYTLDSDDEESAESTFLHDYLSSFVFTIVVLLIVILVISQGIIKISKKERIELSQSDYQREFFRRR